VAYALLGSLAEEVRRDPHLKLEPVLPPTTQWIVFTYQQYDPKSPWYDKRVRLAANHAINRQAINESETLGHSVPTGSIIPRKFDGTLPLEPYDYDPKKAKQLLTDQGA
jgi:ABC-type transport system substrate-binding protein